MTWRENGRTDRRRSAGSAWLSARLAHPTRVVVTGFAGMVAVGTALLALPAASADGGGATVLEALFTATSAVCVTGLIVVDTPVYWSTFGEVVIMGLIQVGGFGAMALASLLALLVARRLSMRMRLSAQTEAKQVGMGDLRQVLVRVAVITVTVEAGVAFALAARLMTGYGEPAARAAYLGLFHSVSAFNNAGFALYSDSLMGFAGDPWICLPIAAAVVVGGVGFPVLLELRRGLFRPRVWSVHTRMTLWATGVLLVAGGAVFTVVEWGNPATLGPMPVAGKALAGFFQGAMLRTAGFNSVDIAGLHPVSLLVSDVLMFVGGGSAGTAGGVKVTTVVVMVLAVWAEVRQRDSSVHVGGRRVPDAVLRQAVAIAWMGLSLVCLSTAVLMVITPYTLDQVLYESVSAFATVGLSTGITADLPPLGQVLLIVLMFVGRLGPITLGAAFALRRRGRRYDLPEARPLIG